MSSEAMKARRRRPDVLPSWTTVLAVVAHPDDESFGLGALLDAFTSADASVEVLCLTHGEASTLHGAPGDLASLRVAEVAAAADVLGVARAMVKDHPDGELSDLPVAILVAEVTAAADSSGASGLLVFDTAGVTSHPDHIAATAAGLLAAKMLNLPVLGWTLSEAVAGQLNQELGTSFIGHQDEEIDLQVTVDRTRQRLASDAHKSQALPSSVLWRRLELLGDTESLRWLRAPLGANGRPMTAAPNTTPADFNSVDATDE